MTKKLDLSGKVFSNLVVIREAAHSEKGAIRWLCLCGCGKITTVLACHLTSGHTKSCGCRRVTISKDKATKHAMSGSCEFKVWLGIRARCFSKCSVSYKKYGGRGITMCDAWRDSFEAFYRDMGPRPSPKHSIERVDVNGNYEPSNCVWTNDNSLQAFNQNRKSNNTSGRSGVYWRKDRARWVAQTHKDGKYVRHGSFKTKEEAVAARITAEKLLYGMEKADELV